MQIINTHKLSREGDRRTLRIQSLLNTRGMIKDRWGDSLAVTVPVNSICFNPSAVSYTENQIKNDIRWKALSEILSIPLNNIIIQITSHPKLKFIYLARKVNPDIGNYIKNLKLPGVFLLEESKRYYPFGKITAQLIGITNIDGKGIEGIEKTFNTLLTGRSGKRQIRKDNKGKIVEKKYLVNKHPSKNLTLTIDKKLQAITYNELYKTVKTTQADSGTAVLINVNTGEILAMANSPSYNPNNVKYIKKNTIRNRAITDMFEPGSTVKPIVIMEALKLGTIKENLKLNTQPYFIKKKRIKDVSYYNQLSITGILQKSSNVGISKIAISMPISKLINSYMQFGLGKPTNLGLIGEKKGFFPHKKIWSNLEKATFSFGYGFMVTPLQLARLYSIIGSYGIYRPLSIIKIKKPINEKRVFPKKYVKKVIRMMESVAKFGGGGIQGAIKGYRVAIKTGTVKKIGKHGYYINKYIAYTAGIAPASNPKFSLIIMIDNPKGKEYYGGEISAPVFSKVMSQVLKIMNIKKDNYLKSKY